LSIRSFVDDFRVMPRNVKVSIYVLPFWAIPFNFVNPYASLYMLNQGISPTKVGLISSLSFILKTIFALFAGYLINRFGRRRTVGVLDLVGWAFPMLLYFFAKEYWQFMLAAVINCITVINGIASPCFLVEDVDPRMRIKAFNFSAITISLCGLFVPITGLLIKKYELVPAIRYLYLFAFLCMGTAAIGKLLFYKETSIGQKMMAQRAPIGNPVKKLMVPIVYIFRNSRLIFLFSMNVLINFALNINNLYYFPFLTDSLGFSNSFISLFPFATTTVSMLIFFFVIPKIQNMEKSALSSVGMYALGALILILSYFTNGKLAIACVICWAMAGAILNPVLNTMIANTIMDEMRTEVFGVFNVFSMLCMFPAGYFGGWLYEGSPLYPIIFIFCVYLAGFLTFFLLGKKMYTEVQHKKSML